jgi:hypothetical protein
VESFRGADRAAQRPLARAIAPLAALARGAHRGGGIVGP